jgi:hypothetical protein
MVQRLFFLILILILLMIFLWLSGITYKEGFDLKNNPELPINPDAPPAIDPDMLMTNKTPVDPASGKPIRKSNEWGAQIVGLQGAYDQFLQFHGQFCSVWTPLINASMDYEIKSEQTNIGSSASAIGDPTPSEYIKILGTREKKTFVDCSVSFPDKLDIGVVFQEMPYSSSVYKDSLDWAIKRASKILEDTKANMANISTANPAPIVGSENFTNASWVEGFLDLTSQNCENKDGVIRCVVSIDTTNRNLYGRLKERLDDFSGKYNDLNGRLVELTKIVRELDGLKKKLESGNAETIKNI